MDKNKIRLLHSQYKSLPNEKAINKVKPLKSETKPPSTKLMARTLNRIKKHSNFIKDIVMAMVDDNYKPSTGELHVQPNDRYALVKLAFTKHSEVSDIRSQYGSQGQHHQKAIEAKYQAMNMTKADADFFNNFYRSLDEHTQGMGNIHQNAHLKYHLRVLAYDSKNGKLTRADVVYARTLAYDTEAIKMTMYISQANRFRP